MTGHFYKPVTKSLLFLSIIFIIGCAEVIPPPGGPEDKQAPIIVQTSPENGSINVKPSHEITFWFSEGITRPGGNKPVFITPRQSVPPKLNWKTDRLVIELGEEFQPNQTYVVTLTSEISDWRRNKMDSSTTIAFSTGDKIDTGSVGGIITSNGSAKGGVLTGLYKISNENSQIAYDSIFPDYLSQSSADGSFKFRYLPDGRFRLIAFDDVLRNEKFNPKEESFAVSDRPIIVGGAAALINMFLELSEPFDIEPKIVSAILTGDRLLKIRTNIDIKTDFINSSLNGIKVTNNLDETKAVRLLGLLESSEEKSSVFTFATSGIDSGKYTIEMPFEAGKEPLRLDNAVIPKVDDKFAPTVYKFKPENKAHFLEETEIELTFSEPIDRTKLTDETFVLTEEQGDAISLSRNWTDLFHLSFGADGLKEGGKYKMTIAEFEISDLTGNLLGDSIRAFEFSVLDSDSLGSVTGKVSVRITSKLEATKKLTFDEINGKQSVDITVPGSSFNVVLPAGKYLLSGYLDENNNGQRDFGMIDPYTFAESFVVFPDTISVRARFETGGIEVTFK